MKRQSSLLLVSLFSSLWPLSVCADVFVLKSGGRVEGALLTADGSPPSGYYLVKTLSGGKIKLAKAQVERVERKSESEQQYEALRVKVVDSADGHWGIAEWCRKEGLKPQREFHLQQVIRHDANHEDARHGLGYSKVDERWVKMDEWMLEQGYVRFRGKWRLRQEIAIEEATEKFELAEKKWRKDLKMWRQRWIDKSRHTQAMENFRAINDPLAALGVGELLEEEQQRRLKLLFIEILGRLDTPRAKVPLIKLAIEDDSDRIRDACLDELEKQGSRQAIATWIKMLKPTSDPMSRKRINHAGIALGRMNDPQAILPLIDSLVTTHKEAVSPNGGGSGIGATFGSGAPGSFNFGGKAKVVSHEFTNDGVLYGLKAITGEDHRFEKETWRRWYIRANTPKNVQLRRDG